jgi:subtilase family serine protease
LAGFDKSRVSIVVALAILLFAVAFIGLPLASRDQVSANLFPTGWTASYFHIAGRTGLSPDAVSGYTPSQIKSAYNLPLSGGAGTTIAIVDADDDPNVASDLNSFSSYFGLTPVNFTEVKIGSPPSDSGWGLEISLDVEWAHAIAPNATILLVEANSADSTDLLNAINYARDQSNVVAISMSWGGAEFSGESSYDSYFTSSYGAIFFASSGDGGAGVNWPAVSSNVIGVGGTTLNLNSNGGVASETGWSGSGGGISAYEPEPSYQQTYGVNGTSDFRGVPDVSYDADPNTGVAVYDSYGYSGWIQVGGTSAGSPQWAAIQALGRSASNANFYVDAKSVNYPSYFRDITNGSNGNYSAGPGYDFVTGLGSPLTTNFNPVNVAPTVHLILGENPNLVTYTRGQSLNLGVTVLNQVNSTLNSTLTLTVTGPGNYYYYDFQTLNVTANTVGQYSFTWNIPTVVGKYVVEVGLVPSQLTAYDEAWLQVN